MILLPQRLPEACARSTKRLLVPRVDVFAASLSKLLMQ